MKILNLNDFVKESAGAPLHMRTEDRFNSDLLDNKDLETVLDRQKEKKTRMLEEIGKQVTADYDWLNYAVVNASTSDEDDMAVEEALYIYYESDYDKLHGPNKGNNKSNSIYLTDIGIDTMDPDMTEAEWNYIEKTRGIDLLDDASIILDVDVLRDKLQDFILNHKNNPDMEKFNYWDFDANCGPHQPTNLTDMGILVTDWQHVSGDRNTQLQYAKEAVQMWVEFVRSLFPRIK